VKFLPQGLAAAAWLGAAGIVFSPLLAALFGTGLETGAVAGSFHRLAAPLGRSTGSALTSAVAALVLGVPFALLVERARTVPKRICWAVGLLVLLVPPYLAAEGTIVLLGPAGKISRAVAVLLGFGPRPGDPLEIARFVVPGFVYTWPAVGVVMGGCLFPIVALAVAAALRRTDRRAFESARLAQGARGVRELATHILVPPALGGALLVFAITLTEFAVPQLLRVRTVGEVVYERIQEGALAAAAAVCLPLLPLVVAAGALGAWVLLRARVASLASLEGEVPKFQGRPMGAGADLAAVAITCWAAIPGLIVPITSLGWLALTATIPVASASGSHQVLRASGFGDSLHGAWDLAQHDAARTVLLAAFAASAATAFAILLVRLTSRAGWGPALGVLGAGLAVPAPLVGLGLIILWNHPGSRLVYQGPAIVLLGWLARFLPVTVFLAQGALARVPRELESAAALAGRGWLGRFAAVVLPNAAPGLVAAWLATYMLSATEFSTTLLIAPPGSPLLAPSVVNLMRRGQDYEIAACQFLLLAVIALPLLLLGGGWLVRAWTRGSHRHAA